MQVYRFAVPHEIGHRVLFVSAAQFAIKGESQNAIGRAGEGMDRGGEGEKGGGGLSNNVEEMKTK